MTTRRKRRMLAGIARGWLSQGQKELPLPKPVTHEMQCPTCRRVRLSSDEWVAMEFKGFVFQWCPTCRPTQ